MAILNALKGLIVVLPVIVSTMGMLMASGAMYNLFVQKSCSPDGPPENINAFICYDKNITDHVNEILSVSTAVKAFCSALFGASLGFLRDLTGKSKILMYVGVTGELLSVSGLFMTTLYWNSSAWYPAITQTIASGSLGDNIMQMGATCILIHQSTPEELPLRLQLYMLSTLVMALAGGMVSTAVLTSLGYRWLFMICIGLQVISFLLIVFLKCGNTPKKDYKESTAVLKNIFKWRENFFVLWLMMIIMPVSTAVLTSEGLNSSTFLQQKFHLTMYKAVAFGTYGFAISIVGSLIGPVILRKVFHFKELTIGIITSTFNAVPPLCFAFAETEAVLYVCATLYFMKLAALQIPSTIISRIIGNDELGTYLGIAGVVTAVLPMGVTGLYREVFRRTQDTWMGAFYLVSSGCFIVLAIIFSISSCLYKETEKPDISESKENLEENIEKEASDLPNTTHI